MGDLYTSQSHHPQNHVGIKMVRHIVSVGMELPKHAHLDPIVLANTLVPSSDVTALAWPRSPSFGLVAARASRNCELGQKPKIWLGLAWLWPKLGLLVYI